VSRASRIEGSPPAGFASWDHYFVGDPRLLRPAQDPPALAALTVGDGFWRRLGGNGWGFGGEIERERAIAARLPR
jgi:hypothetical protein